MATSKPQIVVLGSKMGHLYYMMKMAFKTMYYETGGTPPAWGLPIAELVGDML